MNIYRSVECSGATWGRCRYGPREIGKPLAGIRGITQEELMDEAGIEAVAGADSIRKTIVEEGRLGFDGTLV